MEQAEAVAADSALAEGENRIRSQSSAKRGRHATHATRAKSETHAPPAERTSCPDRGAEGRTSWRSGIAEKSEPPRSAAWSCWKHYSPLPERLPDRLRVQPLPTH